MSTPRDGVAELESGHIGSATLVSLSLASFFPAVAIALVPVLVLSTAGVTAWQSSLLATIVIICVGRAVISFARKYVATGSIYSYVGEVFGPWARYLTGAALLGGFVVAVGALAGVVGLFAGSFLYGRGMTNALELGPQTVILLVAVAIAGAVAYRGLDTSVLVAVTLAVLSVPLVLVITVASAAKTGLELSLQFDLTGASFSGTMQGIALGAAFLVGFESCTALAAETKDPRRSVPLAVMAVPVVMGGLFPIATILQVPGLIASSDQLAAGVSAPAALALNSGLGTGVATATDLVLAAATFAALIGFVNYGARFVMTLAADGLLPSGAARIHPRFHSPSVAIVGLCLLGYATMWTLVAINGDVVAGYNTVAPLVVYCWVVPYLLIAAGAVVLALRERNLTVGLLVSCVVGAAGMGWAYLNGLVNPPPAPADAMSWVVVVLLVVLTAGFALYRATSASARRVEGADLPADA